MIRVKLGSDNVACVRVGRRTFRASATESSRRAALRLTEKVAIAVRAESARYEQYRALSMMAGSAVLRLTFKA
jgi:hypothetical protein